MGKGLRHLASDNTEPTNLHFWGLKGVAGEFFGVVGGLASSHALPFSVSPSGGVMLIHDIRRNESHLIDFRESAPGALREEALQRSWETKVGTLGRGEGLVAGREISFTVPSAEPSANDSNIYYGSGKKKKVEQDVLSQ